MKEILLFLLSFMILLTTFNPSYGDEWFENQFLGKMEKITVIKDSSIIHIDESINFYGDKLLLHKLEDYYHLSINDNTFISKNNNNPIFSIPIENDRSRLIIIQNNNSYNVRIEKEEFLLEIEGWYPKITDNKFSICYGEHNSFIVRISIPYLFMEAKQNGNIIWDYKQEKDEFRDVRKGYWIDGAYWLINPVDCLYNKSASVYAQRNKIEIRLLDCYLKGDGVHFSITARDINRRKIDSIIYILLNIVIGICIFIFFYKRFIN